VVASKRGEGTALVGLRDDTMVFRRDEEFLSGLRWLPDGTVVELRFDGLGVLDPATGRRLHHIPLFDDAGCAPPHCEVVGCT